MHFYFYCDFGKKKGRLSQEPENKNLALYILAFDLLFVSLFNCLFFLLILSYY